MCDLCSSDEHVKRVAIETQKYAAQRLRELANRLDEVSSGRVNPHSENAKIVGSMAREAIRFLVSEWM